MKQKKKKCCNLLIMALEERIVYGGSPKSQSGESSREDPGLEVQQIEQQNPPSHPTENPSKLVQDRSEDLFKSQPNMGSMQEKIEQIVGNLGQTANKGENKDQEYLGSNQTAEQPVKSENAENAVRQIDFKAAQRLINDVIANEETDHNTLTGEENPENPLPKPPQGQDQMFSFQEKITTNSEDGNNDQPHSNQEKIESKDSEQFVLPPELSKNIGQLVLSSYEFDTLFPKASASSSPQKKQLAEESDKKQQQIAFDQNVSTIVELDQEAYFSFREYNKSQMEYQSESLKNQVKVQQPWLRSKGIKRIIQDWVNEEET